MPSPRPDGELVPLARDAEDFGIVPLEVVSAVGLPRLLLSRFAGVRPGDSPKIGAFHVDERTQYVPRAGLRDDASCESLLLAQSDGAASFGEAHPVAARVLATALGCRLVDNGRAVAWPGSIAMRRDLKEAEAVAAALGPLVDAFVATTSRGERVTLLRLVGDIEGALPEDSAESSDFLFFDETPALRDVPVLAADAVGSRRAFAELCYHARRHVALRVDCRVPCGRYVVVGRFADGLTNCRAAQACVAYDDDGRRRALREQLERAYRSVPRPSAEFDAFARRELFLTAYADAVEQAQVFDKSDSQGDDQGLSSRAPTWRCRVCEAPAPPLALVALYEHAVKLRAAAAQRSASGGIDTPNTPPPSRTSGRRRPMDGVVFRGT
mmetsp:Transcript_20318/g.81169  ORF Transcript_20318/g.81169 Transcript_20318/m.81169 type:complete len:382 (-) Transcript_20318:1375-2520(-)